MTKKWIALFSRTGEELKRIIQALETKPDIIMTNNENFYDNWLKPTITLPKIINGIIRDYKPKEVFVTLHGYMRIIPEDLCEKYEIYNGHPGAIDIVPELKGKDPQKKALEMNLRYTYNVIHRVTAGVDEGEILKWSDDVRINPDDTELSLSTKLRNAAIPMWVEFIKEIQ